MLFIFETRQYLKNLLCYEIGRKNSRDQAKMGPIKHLVDNMKSFFIQTYKRRDRLKTFHFWTMIKIYIFYIFSDRASYGILSTQFTVAWSEKYLGKQPKYIRGAERKYSTMR